MLLNLFLQVTLLATAALAKVTAVKYPDDSQKPLAERKLDGVLLTDCDDKISVCGGMANTKYEIQHAVTETFIIYENHTDVITLEPVTHTVTKVEVLTTTTSTEGLCRTTQPYPLPGSTVITIRRNVTTTVEYVPIVNSTVTITSTLSEKKISQCIVKTRSTPELPPAKPSENNGSSPTPTHNNQAKESASPGSSTPEAVKKDADAKKDTAPKASSSKPATPKKP